ncbi:zinc finger CCCH domain-containing protein 61-like [Primulina eburnea]|uniref:zinc finger CCCH domain-containing protein 61-like n=1 Tax=Primulina eburnea TaxID=1245227 RepID=UPI003C6C10CF
MGSTTVCDEQQHKFHHSHRPYPNKKYLREIDIPPRKLLSRRSAAAHTPMSDVFSDSPKAEDAVSKFLPCNNVDEDDSDPYSSDQFRIYEFKVRKCTRSRSHDWTDCPFAHPGEKARRRDPRRFHYSGTVCSEFRKGYCNKGDNCEFSHGVFECWLHPSRYRTEACKDGKNCKRKVCFFAHSTKQLRMSPDPSSPPPMTSPMSEKVYRSLNHCCFCHASPTSPLMGMSHLSPPISPPLSPPVNSPEFSRLSSMESCGFPELNNGGITYKHELTELMRSMESIRMNEAPISHSATLLSTATRRNLPWFDVNNFNVEVEQPHFMLSPSTPSPGTTKIFTGESKFFHGNFSGRNLTEGYNNRYNNEINLRGPDLGWVNDLLT